MTRFHALASLFILLVLCLTVALYWQGLEGIFLVDDTVNLVAMNANGGVISWANLKAFVFGNESGALGRPVAMLSFLLNDQYYPGDVASFRFTNLMIHCLVGVILFLFLRGFLRALGCDDKKAVTCSLLTVCWWLLAPIQVSTVLYPIQRMTQLSTLFTLLGLCCYLTGRNYLKENFTKGMAWVLLGVGGFGLLATLSKENGALIVVYALACEITLCVAKKERPNRFLLVVLLLPLLALAAYFALTWGRTLRYYDYRDFTMLERVLTQLRILGDYQLKGLFALTGKMGLMQDDIVISKTLFNPVVTIVAFFYHAALMAVSLLLKRRYPILLWGVLWFYGGHLLESTFIPLELYFEHRNYLPIAGLMAAVVVTLWQTLPFKLLGRATVVVLMIHAALGCYQRATLWGKPQLLFKTWAYEHPDSMRAQMALAKQYAVTKQFDLAFHQLAGMKTRWPRAFHIDLTLFNLTCWGLLSQPYPAPLLVDELKRAKYSTLLDPAIEELVKLHKADRCPELTENVVHSVLSAIETMEGVNTKVVASSAFWQAEIFIKERNLNGAMLALERSFKYYRNSIPLYVGAKTLASAGLYNDALVYIRRAIDFEENRPLRKQKNLSTYRRIEAMLQETLQRQGAD